MFEFIKIGGTTIAPALFLAPMAGVTHSGFRRLLADFGGYGALSTEMLSAAAFLQEDPRQSAFSRRRECEGTVSYQLRISGKEDIEAVFAKLEPLRPAVVDLNLGCPAPEIQKQASGAALFRDFERLRQVLGRIRACYAGPFTVKCRLGDDPERWREPFLERLKLFEDCGVDAVAVHPRFSTEKLKRRARWREFPWIAEHTRLPVIGNGDVCSPSDISGHPQYFGPLAGLMLGRIVVRKPWIFRDFSSSIIAPQIVDTHRPPAEPSRGAFGDTHPYAEVWDRLFRYTLEDMPPERAVGRMKEFTVYFSQNFFFGHELFKSVQRSRDVFEARDAALRFLTSNPQLA